MAVATLVGTTHLILCDLRRSARSIPNATLRRPARCASPRSPVTLVSGSLTLYLSSIVFEVIDQSDDDVDDVTIRDDDS